jgi:hypothetical protein
MDITITNGEISYDPRFLHVHRTGVGRDSSFHYGPSGSNIERLPKETVAIRAAEYGLPMDHPKALDMVLLEHLIPGEEYPEFHPLFTDGVKEGLAFMDAMMDKVRAKHGEPRNVKFLALAKSNVSRGLVTSRELLWTHADENLRSAVEHFRDQQRVQVELHIKTRQKLSVGDQLKRSMMRGIEEQAHSENGRMTSLLRSPRVN